MEEDRLDQFCLCVSTHNNGRDPVQFYWYSLSPQDFDVDDGTNQPLPEFEFPDAKISEIVARGSSIASLGSKLYFFGGAGAFRRINSNSVYCYDLHDKSLERKENMKVPRFMPRLVVTPLALSSKQDNPPSSSYYIYVVGSDAFRTSPIDIIDPFVEVYDHNMDTWLWHDQPVQSLPSSIAPRGIIDATIVEIDGRKKLFVTLFCNSLTLDLHTNQWEDVTDRFRELRKFPSETPPLFYNGVWYIYVDRPKQLRGFHFNKLFWFTLPGLENVASSYRSYLFHNGDNNFCLVSLTHNLDYVTSSVFYVKFKIKETVDGVLHVDDVWQSPKRTVNGTEFPYCFPIPLQPPPVTEVRSSVGSVTHRGQACATKTGLPSSAPCRPLQDLSETSGASEWQTVKSRKKKKEREILMVSEMRLKLYGSW